MMMMMGLIEAGNSRFSLSLSGDVEVEVSILILSNDLSLFL